jgi:hypothetical protein
MFTVLLMFRTLEIMNSTTIRFFLGMAFLASLSTTAYSRIGETLNEVLSHYGEPLATEVYRGSGDTVIMQEIHFDVEGVSVVVTMVDDFCVRIYYTQAEPFTDFVLKALMEANTGGRRGKFSRFESGSEVQLRTWTTSDRKNPEITGKVLSGTIQGRTIGGNLEVTTLDYVRAEALLDLAGKNSLEKK